MQYVQKSIATRIDARGGGLYEGMLFRWDELDAHNDRFLRDCEVIAHGEPLVFVEHDYLSPPIGKVVHFSSREDGMYVYIKLNTQVLDKEYLSVGGFVYDSTQNAMGGLDIRRFVVLEASLTAMPAQANTPLMQLKSQNMTNMKTQSLNGYATKQEQAQLEVRVEELATIVTQLQAQIDELVSKYDDLSSRIAALEQALNNAQQDVQQTLEKNLTALKDQMGQYTEMIAKIVNVLKK